MSPWLAKPPNIFSICIPTIQFVHIISKNSLLGREYVISSFKLRTHIAFAFRIEGSIVSKSVIYFGRYCISLACLFGVQLGVIYASFMLYYTYWW